MTVYYSSQSDAGFNTPVVVTLFDPQALLISHSTVSIRIMSRKSIQTQKREVVRAARTLSAVHRMSGRAGPAPRGAPERPSLTRRSTSWSAASTRRNTSQVLNEPTWRERWNSRRPRLKSGFRTGGIKPNVGRWRPTWGRMDHRRGWQWKCWWGTVINSRFTWTDYPSHCLHLCIRPTSTTRALTTAAGPGVSEVCRVEGWCEEVNTDNTGLRSCCLQWMSLCHMTNALQDLFVCFLILRVKKWHVVKSTDLIDMDIWGI